MNKVVMSIIAIIVTMLGIMVAVMQNKSKDSNFQNTEIANIKNETNTIIQNVENTNTEIKETNSNEERISPNAFITFKTLYKKCGHTACEYREVPNELVNLTKEELQDKYSEWKIEKFTDTDIVISQEVEGSCNEHFVVKDKDGIAVVYKKQDNGKEEEYETTDISTEYLSETDKMNLKNGIEVNGIQNLNQLIEDYE